MIRDIKISHAGIPQRRVDAAVNEFFRFAEQHSISEFDVAIHVEPHRLILRGHPTDGRPDFGISAESTPEQAARTVST